jgi:2-polyprenyl-3-methyl-5-hydroxy-6-metoxy-1,4-benzoquinol methylase
VWYRQRFATIDFGPALTGYDVVSCDDCGCGYADGIPSQSVFDRYYREMSKYEYAHREGTESAYDRKRLAQIAAAIAPSIPAKDSSILDVGCASGRLLVELRDRGFSHLTGLEPSQVCAAAATRLYGIRVHTMMVSQVAKSFERFDVLIMVGVLEHLRDVSAALLQLRSALRADGMVYVEVPDVTAFADWANAPYQDFSTEHINFFSSTSLKNIMRRNGFGCRMIERNSREQSHRTVMSNISAWFSAAHHDTNDIEFDTDTVVGLQRYIERSSSEDRRLQRAIDAVVDTQREIVVWGVGTHTARLMECSRLRQARIVAFIESNARYHGASMLGKPILAPAALRERKEPVLISSRVFQQEIIDQIRNEVRCSNDLITLYDV